MKKLITPLLMLAALLSSTQAWAENYDLWVGGVQVTDANASNITSSAITAGKVSYNPTNKYLIIGEGTVITRSSGDCINSSIEGLLIVFSGSATITSTSSGASDAGLYLSKPTTLTFYTGAKAPVVTIRNTGNGCAIRTSDRLTIMGNRLSASAANNHAIYGRSSGTLNVNYSQITATGGSGMAGITGFSGGIGLYGSALAANQSISSGAVMQSSSAAQIAYIYCGATIGGVNVPTSSITLNTSNTGASSASGTAQYSSSTNTLTLTNVNVDGANLETHGDMTINFVGGGTISSGGYTMDLYHGNTAITSDGTVTITSTGQNAVYVNGSYSLSINAPEFSALSTGSSRVGMFAGSGTVTLNKYSSSCVYKFAGTGGSFKVKNLVLKDMDISTGNTYWNPSDGYDYYNGSICKASTLNGGTWFQPTSSISYYNLWVAGTHVRQNSAQYIASPYMNVVASYDNSSKTLTLTDATISGQPNDGAAETKSVIYSTISGLTINATGTNNWTSDGITVNLGGGGTNTIKGTGDLKITSNQYHAMNAWNNTGITLARSSGSMSLKGKNRGIYGNNTTTLTINKDGSGALYKFAGEEGNITNLSSLTFGSGVNIQDGYQWFNADEKAVYYRSGLAKCATIDGSTSTWIRSDVEWTSYPIYIAGTQLYGSGSYGNIGGFWNKYVKGGDITYNPSTKTLTLNNATISGDQTIIKSDGDQVTINVKGTNKLTSTGFYGIQLHKQNGTMTFTGDGSIEVTGSSIGIGPWANLCEVAIKDNVKLTAKGSRYGIGGENSGSQNGKLTVGENAVVKASTIGRLYAITLNDGQSIVEPFKARINEASYGYDIVVGSSLAQNVVIQKVEKYDLAVCDVDVNSYNKDDILRDGGTFKYDPSIKRLTITEADIDDPDVSEGVYNYGIEGLNIAIEGENHFRVVDDVFKMKNSTSFSGNGSVKGELTAEDGFGIYLYDSGSTYTSTLNGPKFEFTGYRAVGGSTNNLVIEKGVLAFNPNSSSDARILIVKGLTLGTGMIIAKPEGGTFDSSKKGIVVNGSLYYGYAAICQKGDVNLDGSVTIADAVAVLNAMAGQEVPGDPDVNGDKEVSIADFVAVLNIMAGQ